MDMHNVYASTVYDYPTGTDLSNNNLPAIDPATRRWMCPEMPICLLSSCKGQEGRKQRSTLSPIKVQVV